MNWAGFYDAEMERHNRHLQLAAGFRQGDRVLDIGCGAGQSSRDAAIAAVEGTVLGLDISEEMLVLTRRRAEDAGLQNIAFQAGDAQSYPFAEGWFDLCISRFGVMFFQDPAAAFANIARALRPGGRLVWMVWQGQDRNLWSAEILHALTPGAAPASRAFSLGNPEHTASLLESAGFTSVAFTEVRQPVFHGRDVQTACTALAGLYLAKDAPPHNADMSLQRLRALLERQLKPEGVLFESRAWIISACRSAGDQG